MPAHSTPPRRKRDLGLWAVAVALGVWLGLSAPGVSPVTPPPPPTQVAVQP